MPSKDKNILNYQEGSKSMKIPFIIYADNECLLVKHDTCSNNPEKSYTEKKATHEPCGYSIKLKNMYSDDTKHEYYRGKDCMTKFCKKLREYGDKIVRTEKKPLTPLTESEQSEHEKSKQCHICNGKFSTNKYDKNYHAYKKVLDHDHYTGIYRGAAHGICNLRCETQRIISAVYQNGSNYDFHLIIKELAKEFKTNMKCIGETAEKYISFSVPINVTNDEG